MRTIPSLLLLAALSLLVAYGYYGWKAYRHRRRINQLLAQLQEQYQTFLRQQFHLATPELVLDRDKLDEIKSRAATILKPHWELLPVMITQHDPISWPLPMLPSIQAESFPALQQKVYLLLQERTTSSSQRLDTEKMLQEALDSDIEARLLAWQAGDRLLY